MSSQRKRGGAKRTTSSTSTTTNGALSNGNAAADPANQPPPRPRKKALKSVSKPLSNVTLTQVIYILVLLAALFGGYKTYQLYQYKQAVGGWWRLAMGHPPMTPEQQMAAGIKTRSSRLWFPMSRGDEKKKQGPEEPSVEERIESLATALGMPASDLASAIAVAVRQHVPPASLSSVANKAQETGGSKLVEALLQDPKGDGNPVAAAAAPGGTADETNGGLMAGLESLVGFDEPTV